MNRTVTFDCSDIQKFQKSLKTLGEKTTLKAAKKAAQKGSNEIGKAIRAAAPKRTGQLKHGFKKKQEHSSLKGKTVYDYMPDPAKNEIFQKPIKNVGKYGGANKTGYYPSSVEYGFLTGNSRTGYRYNRGGSLPSRHVEGQHFMRDATDQASPKATEVMKKVLNEELDKEWAKR